MQRPEMKGEGGFARKAEDEVLMEKWKTQGANLMWKIWNDVGRKRQVLLKCMILGPNWDSYQILMSGGTKSCYFSEHNGMILQ